MDLNILRLTYFLTLKMRALAIFSLRWKDHTVLATIKNHTHVKKVGHTSEFLFRCGGCNKNHDYD